LWVVRTPELSTRADPPANTSSSKPQHAHCRPLQLKQPQPSTNQYRVQSLLKPQPPKPSMQMRPNVPSMHLTSPSMQASYPQSKPQCGTACTDLTNSPLGIIAIENCKGRKKLNSKTLRRTRFTSKTTEDDKSEGRRPQKTSRVEGGLPCGLGGRPKLSTRADPPTNTSSSKPQHAHCRPLQLKQPQPSTNQYRLQSLLKP
jgi:hypothetical protein